MKYTAAIFVSITAVASAQQQQQQQRNLASLAQKWNLTEPTFEYNANTFSLTFPVTNFIVDGQAQYTLWTSPDCQSDNGDQLDDSTIFSAHTLTSNAALLAGASQDSGAFTGRAATIDCHL